MSTIVGYELPDWYKNKINITHDIHYEPDTPYDESFKTLIWYIENEMGKQEAQICIDALYEICERAERYKYLLADHELYFKEALKDIPHICETCAWLQESEGYCEVECPHCDVCLKPNMSGSCYCSASEWKWRRS